MEKIRIDRFLSSQLGISRGDAKKLLRGGGVTVNGAPVSKAEQTVDAGADLVSVGGKALSYKKHLYIMMNKPPGVISASRDPKEPTVVDLLPEELKRPGLFPAGRLDKDTTGFVLLTDDGVFAHEI
ncbi:MAG: rRNA pseudouridine synthase, partial [Clostridia bacterium]|nr:rRNA pseudouridine synthase [Clostridia bacterium]